MIGVCIIIFAVVIFAFLIKIDNSPIQIQVEESVFREVIDGYEYIVSKVEIAHKQYEYIPKRNNNCYDVNLHYWRNCIEHIRFSSLETAIDFIKTGSLSGRKKTSSEYLYSRGSNTKYHHVVLHNDTYDIGLP